MKTVKTKAFFRGMKLKDKKDLAKDCAIKRLEYGGEVAIPLKQHAGASALPVVQAGDKVACGQLIGLMANGISANVHASVSGRVKAVEERQNGYGGACVHVIIEQDGTRATAYMPPLKNPDRETIIKRVADAGIAGMGGAGFPTHIKLQPQSAIETLLLNGAECEPYLTCDDRLMREQCDKIVRGARYLQTALGAKNLIVGIEKNKPEAIALFEKTDLPVARLKKRYPMGSEKHLIYCCTGRKVPAGSLPAAVGVGVQNVATAFAVCEAVEEGKPLFERVVTVSGKGVQSPNNLLVPVGTPFEALLTECGANENAVKYVAGGPMTGTANFGGGVVTKTTAGLLALANAETDGLPPTPCINCGKCADVCPMKLMPMQIEFYTAAQAYKQAENYGGVKSCIECGACSYICPARRPLSQAIKTAKSEIRRLRI